MSAPRLPVRQVRGARWRWRLAVPSLLLLSSCMFVLDFDELQNGAAATGGTGGSGGDGAHAGQIGVVGDAAASGGGGGAGANQCGGECVEDDDPCTVARCVDRGSGFECIHEARVGLVLEQEYAPVIADRHFQLGMAVSSSEFYLSALSSDGADADAVIYRLATTPDAELSEAARSSSLAVAGTPLSLPALAVDESSGLLVHAYVALKDLTGAGARVWHVQFDTEFQSLGYLPVGPSYFLNPNLPVQLHHPDARKIGDSVWGAWINADGSITVENASNARQFELGSSAIPASTVALLATGDNQPAALYTGATHGVFLQSEASGQIAVNECQTSEGTYAGAVAAPTSLAGLWFAAWTKSGAGFLTTESKVALCGLTGCAADTACDATEAQNFTRHLALATVHLPGDPAGVLYYLYVVPALAPSSTLEVTASVQALLVRMDFGTSATLTQPPEAAQIGETLLLSSQATSEAESFRGPDLAAAALIGKTAAIAWVEPLVDGRDQVRVQRYALCLP